MTERLLFHFLSHELQADSLPTEPPGKRLSFIEQVINIPGCFTLNAYSMKLRVTVYIKYFVLIFMCMHLE